MGNMIYVCLYVYIAIVFVGIHYAEKIVRKDKEQCINEGKLDDFYFSVASKKRIVEKRKMSLEKLIDVFVGIMVVVALYILGVVMASIPMARELWNGTGQHIDKIAGIMWTFWFSLFGILVVFAALKKDHWLTFSVMDIMKYFRIEQKIMAMLLLSVLVGLFDFLSSMINVQKNYMFYFGFRFLILCAFLLYFLLFLRISWMLINGFFGNKIESIFLDLLYSLFWYQPIPSTNARWTNETIDAYVEYLCENFLYYAQKMKADMVEEIYFSSNIFDEKEGKQKNRYEQLKKRSARNISVGFVFFFWVIVLILHGELENSYAWCIHVIVVAGFGVILYCWGMKNPYVSIFFVTTIFGRYGYEIVFKNQKIRYVREVAFAEWRKYFKYVHSVKNIAAFCYLAIYNNKAEAVDALIKKCSENIKHCKAFAVPMLVIDYLRKEYIENKVKLEISFENEDEKNYYLECAKAFVLDVERSITRAKINPSAYAKYTKDYWKKSK